MRLSDFLVQRMFSSALHILLERAGSYRIVKKSAPLKIYREAGWKEVSQQAIAGAHSGIAKRETETSDQ